MSARRSDGNGQDRRPAMPRRWWTGAMALAALALCGAGCASDGEDLRTPQVAAVVPYASGRAEALVEGFGRQWATLEATCHVAISDPDIRSPRHQLLLQNGKLQFKKPGMVRLEAPAGMVPGLHIVGNGSTYSVKFERLNDEYAGQYGGSLSRAPGRVHVLPYDIALALDPAWLLAGRAVTVRHSEAYTVLDALQRAEDPVPAIYVEGSILVSRRAERIFSIETYNRDGGIRSRIRQLQVSTLPDVGERAVMVPTRFTIEYPQQQTSIMVALTDVKVNEKIPDSAFRLGQ